MGVLPSKQPDNLAKLFTGGRENVQRLGMDAREGRAVPRQANFVDLSPVPQV